MPPSGRLSKLPPKAQQSPALSSSLKSKNLINNSLREKKQSVTEYKGDRKIVDTPIKNQLYYAGGNDQSRTINAENIPN